MQLCELLSQPVVSVSYHKQPGYCSTPDVKSLTDDSRQTLGGGHRVSWLGNALAYNSATTGDSRWSADLCPVEAESVVKGPRHAGGGGRGGGCSEPPGARCLATVSGGCGLAPGSTNIAV